MVVTGLCGYRNDGANLVIRTTSRGHLSKHAEAHHLQKQIGRDTYEETSCALHERGSI